MAFPSAANQAQLHKAEDYLQRLTNLQADFTQVFTDFEGTQNILTGQFSLKRPGKMKFTFHEAEDFIVADGFLIYFYDSQERTQTNAPIGQTLADFILRDKISFDDPTIRVRDVQESNGYTYITLYHAEDEALGSFQMAFSQIPFRLHSWRVIDSQGTEVQTRFDNLKTDVDFPGGFFNYRDPNAARSSYNE